MSVRFSLLRLHLGVYSLSCFGLPQISLLCASAQRAYCLKIVNNDGKGCRTNLVANVGECAHGQIHAPENGFPKFLHQNVATVQGFYLVQKLCDSILEMYEMTEVPKWIAELVI